MRTKLLTAAIVTASLALTAACHPGPERPPAPPVPPTPTNPTNGRVLANGRALAFDPAAELEDASIHPDAGPTLDAAVLDLDTGASSRP